MIEPVTWRFRGSAGDEVTADVWSDGRPRALVIAAHGATSSRRGPYITGAARAWARSGLAVAAADAAGHGERAAGERLTHRQAHGPGMAGRMIADSHLLVDEVQARFPGIPIGYLGFSMGALYGVPFAAAEPRIESVVLAVAGAIEGMETFSGPGGSSFDPVPRAFEIAPRPVLMVNADADEIFDRRAALALYDALAPPKEISYFPGGHAVWRSPAQWYRRMRTFFQETLGA